MLTKFSSCLFCCLVVTATAHSVLQAQSPTVYASVTATRNFVVGATNAKSGLFYQRPSDDTTWQVTGSKNTRAFSFAVHTPARGQLIYIAAGNGVHRTADFGKSWKITTGWEITEVLSVSIDPKNPQNVYVGTAYGIYKSADGGLSWTRQNVGLTALFSSSVMVDQNNSETLYCVTEDGLFRSTDVAKTWQHVEGLRVKNIRVIAQSSRDHNLLVAGSDNNGLYISRNGGKTWAKSDIGIDHEAFWTIAFDPQNADIFYAGGYVTGIYKTVDGGRSWLNYHAGLTNLNIHALAVDPTNSQRLYAGTMWSGIFRSDDGGVSWHKAGLSGAQVWSVSIQPF
jgi:photosystem II stability/assembly factor-like uncharacterized protein